MVKELTASVICMNQIHIADEIKKCIDVGITNFHIDPMDGQYVPRLGMYPEQVQHIKDEFPDVTIDVHVMLTHPNEYIKKFISAGADTIMVHVENQVNVYGSLGLIKSMNAKAGVALNIATDVDFIIPIIDDIDVVMLMGFNPGILNQSLWPGLFKKIEKLKAIIGSRDIDIMIDGGVKFHTIKDLLAAGATRLVGGSSTIFHADNDIATNVNTIKGIINE